MIQVSRIVGSGMPSNHVPTSSRHRDAIVLNDPDTEILPQPPGGHDVCVLG